MLTRRGMADLRRAATLNHLCPALSTRVRVGERTLVDVRWGPLPDPAPAEVLVLHPCAFRMRVTQAWERFRDGRHLRLLGLPHDPAVDVVPVVGGVTWLSGIVRVPQIDQHGYFLATTLDDGACGPIAEPWLARIRALRNVQGLSVFGDRDTNITVIQVDVGPIVEPTEEEALVDLLEQLAGSFAAAELLDDLELSEPT